MPIPYKLLAVALAGTVCFNLAQAGSQHDESGHVKVTEIATVQTQLVASGTSPCPERHFGPLDHIGDNGLGLPPSTVVPEPSTSALLLCGLGLYALCVHRNGRQDRD